MDTIMLDVKPMSVNEAWQGHRYKTDEYKVYEHKLLWLLPRRTLPAPPYKVFYEYGVSNKAADYDNPTKPLQDILQKKYHFDDKEIYEAHIIKRVVPKGKEYIKIGIEHLDQ